MILVGNDIVEVTRIKELINSYNQTFLDKIFTKKEQKFCLKRENSHIHFAGRFAGKEAIKKILLQISSHSIEVKKIEILRKIDSPPKIFIDNQEHQDINISISHTENYATAVAIMEIK